MDKEAAEDLVGRNGVNVYPWCCMRFSASSRRRRDIVIRRPSGKEMLAMLRHEDKCVSFQTRNSVRDHRL